MKIVLYLVMEKTIKQRRLEFLDETVAFYSEDTSRRALQNRACKYRTDDGKKCAIGRVIPDELYTPAIDALKNSSVYYIIDNPNLCYIIPLSIRELGANFLFKVQRFHDMDHYWGPVSGLTSDGLNEYNAIKLEYCTE